MFFGLLLAIMETGVMFLRSNALEAGVEEAKRVTMTGQVAGAPMPVDLFRSAFCAQAGWIIDCNAIHIDVRSSKYWGATMTDPISGGAIDPSKLAFVPGAPCEIVVIRIFLEVEALTSFLRNDVSNLSNGNLALSGTAVFKNEPFGTCS